MTTPTLNELREENLRLRGALYYAQMDLVTIKGELDEARAIAARCGYRRVEFFLGEGPPDDLLMPVERIVEMTLRFRLNEALLDKPFARTLAFLSKSFLHEVEAKMLEGFEASSLLRLPVPIGEAGL